MSYSIANLADMLDVIGEDRVKHILSVFSCPLNRDVEDFLHSKAIEFAKQGISATHLVFKEYKDERVLVGYFTLANKTLLVSKDAMQTDKWRKRIKKFAVTYDQHNYILSAMLIAQLGKNFKNNYNTLITGDELLKIAVDKVERLQRESGGKWVYLECEDKPKLITFYESNGFQSFGSRKLSGAEHGLSDVDTLIQMVRYLSGKSKK